MLLIGFRWRLSCFCWLFNLLLFWLFLLIRLNRGRILLLWVIIFNWSFCDSFWWFYLWLNIRLDRSCWLFLNRFFRWLFRCFKFWSLWLFNRSVYFLILFFFLSILLFCVGISFRFCLFWISFRYFIFCFLTCARLWRWRSTRYNWTINWLLFICKLYFIWILFRILFSFSFYKVI